MAWNAQKTISAQTAMWKVGRHPRDPRARHVLKGDGQTREILRVSQGGGIGLMNRKKVARNDPQEVRLLIVLGARESLVHGEGA